MPARPHIALAVRDLDRSIAFYANLLGCAPAKVRPGFAKFAPDDPPLSLSLNVSSEAVALALPQHLGIEVEDVAAVHAARARLESAGLETKLEEEVECCYAVQTKVWTRDPDGHPWEVYALIGDVETPPASCCDPACCA